MRAIPKSRLLAAVEMALLVAIVAACAALWIGRRTPVAVVRLDGPAPMPQKKSVEKPPRPVAAVPKEKDKNDKLALRLQRPVYARSFEELYENPKLNTLHLTDEQLDALQDCCNQLYVGRLELEARLAQVERVEGDGVFIEIPAYPEAGKALEQAFISSLSEKFGDEMAGAIEAQYLEKIEAQNESLGQRTQQFLVNPDADNAGRLKIVYTSASPDGSFNMLNTSLVTESNLGEYGPLAAFFPKP